MKDLLERAIKASATFLERRGYEILDRNWSNGGSAIDIVARDEDGVIVVVDVKARVGADKGFPIDTEASRERLESAAAQWLALTSMPVGHVSGSCAAWAVARERLCSGSRTTSPQIRFAHWVEMAPPASCRSLRPGGPRARRHPRDAGQGLHPAGPNATDWRSRWKS